MRTLPCLVALAACQPEPVIDSAPLDAPPVDEPDKGVETVTLVRADAVHLMRLPTPDAPFLLHEVTVPTTRFYRDGVTCEVDVPIRVTLVRDPFFGWEPLADGVIAGNKAAPEAAWGFEEPLPLEGDAALWLAVERHRADERRSACLLGDQYDSDVADTWIGDASGWTPMVGLIQRVTVTTSVVEG